MLNNRYEFVLLFDVKNGNPNGDMDADNSPRQDPESGHGYVTDVCLKRKVRDYVDLVYSEKPGYQIMIKPGKALNTRYTEAYQAAGLELNQKGSSESDVKEAAKYICQNYFDVRAFGAVMNTGDDRCGTLRGPVQFTYAESIDPVQINEVSITRQARTTEKARETGETEIGHKFIVPYGLYRAEGFISAALADKTELSEADLEVLFEAIINMFEHDRSAARGNMNVRKLIIFKHDSKLGNCPAGVLFDKVKVENNLGRDKKDERIVARSFNDYDVTIDRNMPEGVELIEKM